MSLFDRQGFEPLKDILRRALLEYLEVRPQGLILKDEPQPQRIARARLFLSSGARTLYRHRRPACRSLDGIQSITDKTRRCANCCDRPSCTPQVRVDLVIGRHYYRALWAYTSARNFLMYEASLHADHLALAEVDTQIEVIDRGSWGELRFQRVDPDPR